MLKNINLKRVSKEATWIIIGQAGTAIAGLFGVKLLTNVLSPGEFGKVALANTIVALVSTNFLFGPLGQGMMRFWAIAKDRASLSEFYAVSNQLKRNAIAISILAGSLLVVTVFFMRGMEWSALLAVSCVVGIFGGWLGLRTSVFTAARKRQLVALLNIGNAFLRPVFAVCFILLLTSSAFWAMTGYLLAAIVLVSLAEWFYQKKFAGSASSGTNLFGNISTGIKKEIISFSWPFAVWGIFGWVHLSADKWALQTFYGPEIVGPFAVVTLLAVYPLTFGSGFLSTLIVPVAY